jgi:hypothetical protein
MKDGHRKERIISSLLITPRVAKSYQQSNRARNQRDGKKKYKTSKSTMLLS